MYKVFTLCIFALILSFSLQAQSVTRTGSVDISIGIIPNHDPPECTLETTSATLNFGTVTGSRTTGTKTASTRVRLGVTGGLDRNQPPQADVSRTRLSNGDATLGVTNSTTCSCTGGTERAGRRYPNTCECEITSSALLPASPAPGTYTGTATFSVRCF